MILRPWHVPLLLGGFVLVIIGYAALTREPGSSRTQPPGTVLVGIGDPGWPLSVLGGTLRCEGNAVTLETPQGVVYALNGLASGLAERQGWVQGRTVQTGDVGPLIRQGLALCQM